MLASGFSFAGMFSFLSAGPFVYIELNHVSPQHFGYYFALNVVFIFVLTMINSRFVRRVGALNMFRIGLWIQFVMAVWMVVTAFFDVGFWTLVIGIAAFVGCISIVSSNAMAVILDEFPHMAGTASSLAGTFPLRDWRHCRCVALPGYLYHRLADALVNCLVRDLLDPFLPLRQPATKSSKIVQKEGSRRGPFLMLVKQSTFHRSPVCFFYVKSICVNSHSLVVKKVVLDHRNGYI
ncbi:Sulfonamide resistance protein [Leclercia adecarboxylata]|uniref:Sulfonamide resistance protein n=1 Tax=Leclercia adecarboxylata TaxID=83655 RepID=A0A4U9I4S6_9ENTR|nr:Sulfonamide resistance protein [Leclercia adecarboxylata]